MSPKSKPTKPIAIYVRVSRTNKRDVESEGETAAEQESRCRSQLAADGLTPGEVYVDLDESGGKTSRPAFDRMLASIEDGTHGGVIVRNLRRFGRSTAGVLGDGDEGRPRGVPWIEKQGAAFLSVEEKIDTSTAMGEFALTIFAALGSLELRQRREGWAEATRNAIDAGIHVGATPIGYLRDEKTRKLVPDPATREHVAEAFRMRIGGESIRKVHRYLAEHCTRKDGTAMLRQTPAVRAMLSNRIYLGEVRSGEHVHQGAHEPLVSAGRFHAAQREQDPATQRLAKGHGEVLCSRGSSTAPVAASG